MSVGYWFLCAFLGLAGFFPLVLLFHCEALFAPRKPGKGGHIAEVWLEWDVCRGSTLYRQRFQTQWMAALFAKFYAVQLDWVLPTHWRTTDYCGRPCLEKYAYGLKFGVRPVSEAEAVEFWSIWSPHLPGPQATRGNMLVHVRSLEKKKLLRRRVGETTQSLTYALT
jgi:hypothetical protein